MQPHDQINTRAVELKECPVRDNDRQWERLHPKRCNFLHVAAAVSFRDGSNTVTILPKIYRKTFQDQNTGPPGNGHADYAYERKRVRLNDIISFGKRNDAERQTADCR